MPVNEATELIKQKYPRPTIIGMNNASLLFDEMLAATIEEESERDDYELYTVSLPNMSARNIRDLQRELRDGIGASFSFEVSAS